ncbi:hypothetical protein HPB50_007570 [Hyalomma asiaticum]|uniref:Uncharacterized protein n=1 Tax=Hyalomma asiaticum TaxID=266040 RepID=A0ACB7TE67_HYAAI|nr:hypothetical protein HPB50_007570 [Hyalomma asiaticum]
MASHRICTHDASFYNRVRLQLVPMGRDRTNRARRHFKYDSVSNKSICQIEICQHVVSGDHGGSLERHLQRRHKEVYDSILADKASSTKHVVSDEVEGCPLAKLRQVKSTVSRYDLSVAQEYSVTTDNDANILKAARLLGETDHETDASSSDEEADSGYPEFEHCGSLLDNAEDADSLGLDGAEFKLRVRFYNGTIPFLLVADVDLLKKVQIEHSDAFLERGTVFEIEPLPDYRHKLIVTAPVSRWREMRAVLSPAFTISKLSQMFVIMDKCSDTMIEKLEEKRTFAPSVEITQIFRRATIDTMLKAGYGVDLKVQDGPYGKFFDELGKGADQLLRSVPTCGLSFLARRTERVAIEGTIRTHPAEFMTKDRCSLHKAVERPS